MTHVFSYEDPMGSLKENAFPVIEGTIAEADVDVKTRLIWRESVNRELNVLERTPY